jgi:WD40 repeat protein
MEELKEKGNEAYKNNYYKKALNYYNKAIVIALMSSSRYFISESKDGSINVWNCKTLKCTKTIEKVGRCPT